MKLPYYHVDAFTDACFSGNPAGVCVLETWLPDEILQRIAAENNLSETAFFIQEKSGFDLRWFTPAVEVDLCGHATLAAASVIFRYLNYAGPVIAFSSKSGPLAVAREGDLFVLDFPSRYPQLCNMPGDLAEGLGTMPLEVRRARDYFAVYGTADEIREIKPDFRLLERLDSLGIIVTAPGKDVDFVSRFFAPKAGLPEDPVTGSAHCSLIPYWSERLGKKRMQARQLSARGGELFCEDKDDRVKIGGKAVTYLASAIEI